ncbi:hypothetical protein BVX99_00100 [bacterium F16]|nr:hypothetical protein BVX99_00100 [bacterium F16]
MEHVPKTMRYSQESKRILVVDDDVATRKIVSWILLGMGYEVSSMESGAEAFEKLLKAPKAFKLVITGAKPVDFSGLVLIKAVRHIPATATIPMLFMAQNPLMELALAELEYSRTSFAPKPIYKELLEQEIDRLLTGENTPDSVVI